MNGGCEMIFFSRNLFISVCMHESKLFFSSAHFTCHSLSSFSLSSLIMPNRTLKALQNSPPPITQQHLCMYICLSIGSPFLIAKPTV